MEGEDPDYAAVTPMSEFDQSADYTGVYSVFGRTGTFEESANFVNTISNDKTETHIKGKPVTPSEDKPDTYPGVQIGDTITYKIKWANNTGAKARVVIIDPLDEGVDFVEASNEGEYYKTYAEANKALAEIYGDFKQNYDHVVIWDLGKPEDATGTVTLTVKVNENAAKYWDYDKDGDADKPAGSETDTDLLVRNRATVRVADNSYFTNTVLNPVGQPEKTETYIDHLDESITDETITDEGVGANLTEGDDGKWHAPLVYVGDKITYEIEWRNYKNEEAVITIRDPLDANVRFISASFDLSNSKDNKGETIVEGSGYNGAKNATLGPATTTGDEKPESGSTDETKVDHDNDPDTDTVPVIQYTNDDGKCQVVWNLGKQPAGSSGKVTLVVEVLSTATPVGFVDNTAYVQVNGDAEQQTRTVENPTPHVEKTELTPGDGKMVGIGDYITYDITWHNYKEKEARVIIMDTLDPGVDFVRADNGAEYYDKESTIEADGDLAAIDIPAHTVVWTLNNQPANAEGTVSLTVKVNEKAKLEYKYNDAATELDPGDPGAKDYQVLNQARVKVGNDAFLKTQIVDNPVPEKTETEVNHIPSGGADDGNPTLTLKPGTDNTYTGPLVYVGDVITYSIHWKNGHNESATVTIRDELDPGVEFVSASYDTVTLESGAGETGVGSNITITYDEKTRIVTWTLNERPGGAEDDVTLKVKVTEKATPVGYVDNQALVKVDGDPEIKTEIIENPTPNVEKIETSPGEGMQVMPGDEIGYEITWHNHEPEAADVIIIDKLDPGVDFVSAEANRSTLTNGTEVAKPEKANLIIALKGDEASKDTEFEFTLTLTDPEGKDLESSYGWQKGEKTGNWTKDAKTITLKPGEVLTVKDLPVGTVYTLTSETNGKEIVKEQKIGLYGSSVTVTVTETKAEPASVPAADTAVAAAQSPAPTAPEEQPDQPDVQPASDPDDESQDDPGAAPDEDDPAPEEKDPVPGDTADPTDPADDTPGDTTDPVDDPADEPTGDPGDEPTGDDTADSEPDAGDTGTPEGTAPGGTQEPAPSTSAPEIDGIGSDETEPDEPKTTVIYTFTAVVEDLPAPQNTSAPGYPTWAPMAIIDGTGFDPEKGTLNGEEAISSTTFTDTNGKQIGIYYFSKAHTVIWLLKDRESDTSGLVDLKVRVNEDADKFWSYDHPDWGPSASDNDFRVRNQAGVKVGSNPEVKTRIIENPTKPEKTETQINDEDVEVRTETSDGGNIKVGPEVSVGDVITYTVTWQNNVVDEATGIGATATVQVIDTFMTKGLEYVSAGFVDVGEGGKLVYSDEIPAGWTINRGTDADGHITITWTIPNQDFKKSGMVWVKARVTSEAIGRVENSAEVVIGEDHQDAGKVENPISDKGGLKVTKYVTGNAADTGKSWSFTVTLSDKTINGRYGQMEFTEGVATFTLKHGESLTATGLPEDIEYTVTETEANKDGYTTSSRGSTGTIPAGRIAEAVFTNHRGDTYTEPHNGNLVVTKYVTGALGDREKLWHFRVELSQPLTGRYGNMDFVNGVAEFTLKHGQSMMALALPDGITYTVTELEANLDDYVTSSTGETGRIPAGGTAEAEFTNYKGDNPPPPPPPTTPDRDLYVEKYVTGTRGEKDRDFHFRVELSQPLTGQYGDLYFRNGVAEFTLRDGQTVHASGLPDGVTYTVTEIESNQDGYKTTATGATGVLPGRAVFNNSRGDDTDLEVDKTVINGDTNRNFRFRVELSDKGINGVYGAMTFVDGVAEFTLRHGQKLHALGLPAGITYTVTELDANADGYTTSSVGATGTLVEGERSLADFINSKPDKPDEPDIPHDDTPETGDNSRIGRWLALMILSALGMAIMAISSARLVRLVSSNGKHIKK